MKPEVKTKKRIGIFDWLIWWKIDKDELQKQVDNYEILTVTKSARGVSFLLILLSNLIGVIFILSGSFDQGAWWDIALLFILGLFIYKGHRWAMIVVMIYWTIDRIIQVSTVFSSSSQNTSSIWWLLLWWTIFMHAFYRAFRVERLRVKTRAANNTNNVADETPGDSEALFCSHCGKQIDSDSKFCIHCGKEVLINPQKSTEI